VKSIPATGSTDVDPSIKEIKVVYSKNMQNGTWSWSQLGKETFPKLDETGKIHYESDKRTCVLPVKLEPGKTYAIFCNSPRFHNFKDKEGSPAVPYMLVFRTRK
jgi:RNA polymerase sigma-70 factor (ECF subfamily)